MEILYETQVRKIQRKIWFDGSGSLEKGQGLCYNRTVVTSETGETAADKNGKRDKTVSLPSAANCLAFAGVTDQSYTAKTGGQWIIINEPGSVCEIYTGETSLALGFETMLICTITASNPGYFYAAGASKGKGNARLLSTVSAAGTCLAELMTGEESGLVEVIKPVAAGGAITLSKCGTTLIDGSLVSAAHCTNTLANGTFIGQRKRIKVSVLIGASKNFVLTVTSGVQLDGATALASITFNAANEESELEWMGPHWKVIANAGATLA